VEWNNSAIAFRKEGSFDGSQRSGYTSPAKSCEAKEELSSIPTTRAKSQSVDLEKSQPNLQEQDPILEHKEAVQLLRTPSAEEYLHKMKIHVRTPENDNSEFMSMFENYTSYIGDVKPGEPAIRLHSDQQIPDDELV
jgi:hypothetical protein